MWWKYNAAKRDVHSVTQIPLLCLCTATAYFLFKAGDVQLPVLTTPWQLIHQTKCWAVCVKMILHSVWLQNVLVTKRSTARWWVFWSNLSYYHLCWSSQYPSSVLLQPHNSWESGCHSTASPFRQHQEGVFHSAHTQQTHTHTWHRWAFKHTLKYIHKLRLSSANIFVVRLWSTVTAWGCRLYQE